MEHINWENFRRNDTSIDLLKAWKSQLPENLVDAFNGERAMQEAEMFFKDIQNNQPIISRQVAALILASANFNITIKPIIRE